MNDKVILFRFIRNMCLFLLSILFLWNGLVVEASEVSYDSIYEINQIIPEKEDTDENLTELKYELNHKAHKIADKSNWLVYEIDEEGKKGKDITNWFEQDILSNGSMQLKLKKDYLNSSELYGKQYLIQANVLISNFKDDISQIDKQSFQLKQYVNGNLLYDAENLNDSANGNQRYIDEDEPIRVNDIKIYSEKPLIKQNNPTKFVYNEANVREMFGIGNQFKREYDINRMQLVTGYTSGNVLRFHPSFKFNYMMYTYSNGIHDTTKFVSPDFPGIGGNGATNINQIVPHRGIYPMVSNDSSLFMTPINTPIYESTSLTAQGRYGINGRFYEDKILTPFFFKDSQSNILKGVTYDEINSCLMEITLSIDTYTGSGQVGMKLLNVSNQLRNFAIYETTEWQTNDYFSTIPNLKYGNDGKTPIGYQVVDSKKGLEFALSYRNSDGSFISDNQYFYTGNRTARMFNYTGTSDDASRDPFYYIFPYLINGHVDNYFETSQHQIGSVIAAPGGASTGVQTNAKKVSYGEYVEYGYDYYFGKERKGLVIDNGKSNIVEYEDVKTISNSVDITNPSGTINNAQINLIVDGKGTTTIATNQTIQGSGKTTSIPYEIDVEDLGIGSYRARIEVVNHDVGRKSYGNPISINILKTYRLDYEMERTISKYDKTHNTPLGNDYFSIVPNSLNLDSRYDNNIQQIVLNYPSNSELIFWDGTDLSAYVASKLGKPVITNENTSKKMSFDSIGNLSTDELNLILSSIVLTHSARGEQLDVNDLKIELTTKDGKSKETSKKLPGAIKINYLDLEQNLIDVSKFENAPDYVYGTYRLKDKLPEFKLESEETNLENPYYPNIEGYEFVERNPSELVVSENSQTVDYIYKISKVNVTVNYYQWVNDNMSTQKIVDDLSKGSRKNAFSESISIENKTIEELLDDNKKLQAPTFKGYVFNESDVNKTIVYLNDNPNKIIPLSDKMPVEAFTINYYYEPTVQLNVPTNINFGIRQMKTENNVFAMESNKEESDNNISIIDTYETALEKPGWSLYASTDGFYSAESGTRLLADVLLKTPEFSTPKVITNESTPLFVSNEEFEKNISLVDAQKKEGLYVRVGEVGSLGKYNGVLKYKLQAAP